MTITDQLITEYIAVDKSSEVLRRIADQQERLSRHRPRPSDTTRQVREIRAEASALEATLRVAEREERLRTQVWRSLTQEARLRDTVARAAERQARAQERAARAGSFGAQFRAGFGSTPIDLGGAMPLLSAFGRGPGGVAGALTGTLVGGSLMGARSLTAGALGAAQSGLGVFPLAAQAASDYEARLARLTAIVGDADLALRKLGVAQAVAAPSPFTTRQLSEATVLLEAMGINAERALPIIGKLGAAMGADDERLQMFTRAIGELGAGNMIDADVMAAMGLSRADFARQGVQFDGSGKLLSSAVETLTALERIVEERYGNVLDQMAGTADAKRASLADAGERAMAAFGQGILRAETPVVEMVTRVLTAATDSGVLAEVGQRTGLNIGALLGLDGRQASAVRMVSVVLATIEGIPAAIRVGVSNAQELWRVLVGAADAFGERLGAHVTYLGQIVPFLGQNLPALLNPFTPGSEREMLTARMGAMGTARDARLAAAAGLIRPARFQSLPDFGARATEIEGRLTAALGAGGEAGPVAGTGEFLTRAQQQQDTAERIERNTRETARSVQQQVDVQQMLFGGGDRARSGIDIVQALRGGSRGSQARFEARVGRAATLMERAVLEIVRQNVGYLSHAVAGGRL